MLREKMEEYLDGGLDAAGTRAMEAQVASDAAAARLLAGIKSERALRAAAYDSYAPTRHEAAALAARLMAEAQAPVGRIGYWVRRGAAVAAAIAIVAGTFMAGRISVTPQEKVQVQVEKSTVYNVVYTEPGGDPQVRDFASIEERDNFVKDLEQRGATGIAVADLTTPGRL